ncbi:unnamed protein product [Blepharisma stoltei]|uniref:Kinesin-like protein n=1 Tax=Blepharisma stoltei TaxID=1481888 RepID=A0AAU9ISZ8_9CILI|nr:unnamed protein product [Blepharisma stoltei]
MDLCDDSNNVQVFCRVRPLNDMEKHLPSKPFIDISADSRTITAHSSNANEPIKYNFDYVFIPPTPQSTVYEKAARPIVESVMQGFNGTVFAYGQTSSGKTYTMTGPNSEDPNYMGIIPRMVTTIFVLIENADENIEFTVKISYCEIYCEKIRDLMISSKENLKIREDRARGVYIDGLTEVCASTGEEIYEIMKLGNTNRATASTKMNNSSSRSHSIFSITVTQSTMDFSTKVGKLHLIDLAGSEKVGKTTLEGIRLEEAKKINKSLAALGAVITALSEGKKSHIPYRDSKLTRILENSLGGNSKTSLIVTCSPSHYNEEETLSTLRFGVRAKLIKNKPKINKEFTVSELKLLLADAKEEIKQKDMLIKLFEEQMETGDCNLALTADTSIFGDEDLFKPEYMEVIQELELTKQKMLEEMEIKRDLQERFEQIETENAELSAEYNNLVKYAQEICDEKNILENLLRDKEEIIDKLTAIKDSYESKFENFQNEKLRLEKKIVEKDVEIEYLKRRARASAIDSEEDKKLQISEEREKNILRIHGDSLSKLSMIKDGINEEIYDENIWKNEKLKLVNQLQIRIKSIIDLEIELEDAREVIKKLENSKGSTWREERKQNSILERQLEQLTIMYHQLAKQQSESSLDSSIKEKKIHRLTEKSKKLEEELKSLKSSIKEYEFTSKALKDELKKKPQSSILSTMGTLGLLLPSPKIKKSIKGGGNSKFLAVFADQARTSSAAFNRLSLNNELQI